MVGSKGSCSFWVGVVDVEQRVLGAPLQLLLLVEQWLARRLWGAAGWHAMGEDSKAARRSAGAGKQDSQVLDHTCRENSTGINKRLMPRGR